MSAAAQPPHRLTAPLRAERPPRHPPRRRPSYAIPLPDTELLTIRPAPEREPPFDDELDLSVLEPLCPTQRQLPFPPTLAPVRHRPDLTRAPRRAGVPDPAVWARRLLIGVVEVSAGRRPLAQLTGLLSASVAIGLRGDLERTQHHRLRTATVGTIRASEPTDGVAELAATLRTRHRVHAAALRLEIRRGQWICTRLVIG